MRHFRVHDASSGGHELQVTGVDLSPVARKILVIDCATQEVSDGFLAAMRMIWKTSLDTSLVKKTKSTVGYAAYPHSNVEMIEHEKRREVSKLRRSY